MMRAKRALWRILPRPSALTMEQWNTWERRVRRRFPLRHKIDRLRPKMKALYWRWIVDPIWEVRYRTTDNYTVLRMRELKPGLHEAETQLLYASFQLLTDQVEIIFARYHDPSPRPKPSREHGLAWIGQMVEGGEGHENDRWVYQTMRDLYLWWRNERPRRIDPQNDSSIWSKFDETVKDEPKCDVFPLHYDVFRECDDKARALSKAYFDEDTEKLTRLIEIRGYLR